MGTPLTLARALALDVAQSGCVSVELSLAAILSLNSRTLRGSSAGEWLGLPAHGHGRDARATSESRFDSACARCSHRDRNVDVAGRRSLCFSAHVDFTRARRDLGSNGTL